MVLTLVSTCSPQVAPQQICRKSVFLYSWLELLHPWLTHRLLVSNLPFSPSCPLFTWSPLVYLKPTHARFLFTACLVSNSSLPLLLPLGLHSSPSSCPAANSAAKSPPSSWLEFLLPWLNSINPLSPTLLSSPPCPLLTWSPLVFLKLSHVPLLTDWSPTYPPLTATATGPGFRAPPCFLSLRWSDMVLLAKAAVQLILPWLKHLSRAETPVLGP